MVSQVLKHSHVWLGAVRRRMAMRIQCAARAHAAREQHEHRHRAKQREVEGRIMDLTSYSVLIVQCSVRGWRARRHVRAAR